MSNNELEKRLRELEARWNVDERATYSLSALLAEAAHIGAETERAACAVIADWSEDYDNGRAAAAIRARGGT